MERLIIKGGNQLHGEVNCSGAKNSGLLILASTILLDTPARIGNLPHLQDITTMLELLNSMGALINFDESGYIEVDSSNITVPEARYELVKTMRASVLVMGPLVAKYGNAKVSTPGGCTIGVRPIDIHLKALAKLGVNYRIINGYVHANSKKKLKGAKIKFSKISVGATENLIIAASMAEGTSTLSNCAIEPEIKDLTNFLKSAGANIKWIGKRTCQIIGVNSLNQTTYSVMGDRIETGTFCVAATLAKGDLVIKNFNPNVIQTELNLLKKVGAKIKISKNEIIIKGPKKIKNISNIKTKEYPNFPTDLQAQFMVLLCKANGRSTITESIFENRFMHVAELRRLGAKIIVKDNKATIEGKTEFLGAELMSSDLRASVALVLAAIVAKGQSTINRIYHLDRGYEKIENKLKKIGVKIKRLS